MTVTADQARHDSSRATYRTHDLTWPSANDARGRFGTVETINASTDSSKGWVTEWDRVDQCNRYSLGWVVAPDGGPFVGFLNVLWDVHADETASPTPVVSSPTSIPTRISGRSRGLRTRPGGRRAHAPRRVGRSVEAPRPSSGSRRRQFDPRPKHAQQADLGGTVTIDGTRRKICAEMSKEESVMR